MLDATVGIEDGGKLNSVVGNKLGASVGVVEGAEVKCIEFAIVGFSEPSLGANVGWIVKEVGWVVTTDKVGIIVGLEATLGKSVFIVVGKGVGILVGTEVCVVGLREFSLGAKVV